MDHRNRRTGAEFDRKVAIETPSREFSLTFEPQLAREPSRRSMRKEFRRAPRLRREAVHAPPAVAKAGAVALESSRI